jgi:hypothetical protein
MYSPKIPDPLIPVLYRLAQDRKQPMTVVVSELLLTALEEANLPDNLTIPFLNAKTLLQPLEALKEAA